ncbi:TadE family type IV pilus minor pilin [Nonomuraea africana]|uniref:TadE family type IV pilus minor pilin n=1 Tax=Nonomuraea africana TaxID=46171 RepID=UPI0033E264B8
MPNPHGVPRSRTHGRRFCPSRGSVTAETAAVLPALMVVLAAALWAVTVVNAQLRCVDAARTGARAAARGEPITQVQELARSVAPQGAQIDIRRGAEMTSVQVTTHIKPAWAAALPPVEVKASATSATEPGILNSAAATSTTEPAPELPDVASITEPSAP